MNVLVLVFTMLALLSIMTYTRLESFLGYAGVRIEYRQFMSEGERKEISRLEDKKYQNAKSQSKPKNKDLSDEDKQAQEEELTQEEASFSKLNVAPLIAPDTGTGSVETQRELTSGMFKRLIEALYSKQPFFEEASKDRNVVEDLLNEIQNVAQEPPCELKFTSVKDLVSLPFKDEKLREIYYKMLKGEPAAYSYDSQGKKVKVADGYGSLLDYLTLSKKNTRIRIWLARKALLEAIYRDPQSVQMLMDKRSELHKQIQGDFVTAKDAGQDLKDSFSVINVLYVDPNVLDFKASRSRPPRD